MAPGSRSGPRTTSPMTSSTSISPHPTLANIASVVRGGVHRQRDLAAIADHLDRGVLADLQLTDRDREFIGVGHRAVTDLDHDVVLEDAGFLSGTTGLYIGHLSALREVIADRARRESERRVRDLAVLDQCLDGFLDLVDRDREAQATC